MKKLTILLLVCCAGCFSNYERQEELRKRFPEAVVYHLPKKAANPMVVSVSNRLFYVNMNADNGITEMDDLTDRFKIHMHPEK